MKLVTVVTDAGGYFPYLVQSCHRYQAELVVLGWKEKWQGFIWRLGIIRDYISKLDDNEIVCFIDAYDVILLRPLDQLETAFKQLSSITGARLIIGCEQYNSIVWQLLSKWIFGKCHNKNVNAGTYIGYASDIMQMLDSMLQQKNDTEDDQILITKYCNATQKYVHVDCDNILFLTCTKPLQGLIDEYMTITENKELIYKGGRPFFIHGNANADMRSTIRALGYEITPEENNRIMHYQYIYGLKKVLLYLKYFVGIAVFIVLIWILYLIIVRYSPRAPIH